MPKRVEERYGGAGRKIPFKANFPSSGVENVVEVRNFSSRGLCLRFTPAEHGAPERAWVAVELQVTYPWGAVRATPVWVSKGDPWIDVGFRLSLNVGELESPVSVENA
jgi:hypothetical protein